MFFPERVARRFREITELYPNGHFGRAGEIVPSETLAFFRDVRPVAVGVQDVPIVPTNLCGFGIYMQAGRLAPRFPSFPSQRHGAFLLQWCLRSFAGLLVASHLTAIFHFHLPWLDGYAKAAY